MRYGGIRCPVDQAVYPRRVTCSQAPRFRERAAMDVPLVRDPPWNGLLLGVILLHSVGLREQPLVVGGGQNGTAAEQSESPQFPAALQSA